MFQMFNFMWESIKEHYLSQNLEGFLFSKENFKNNLSFRSNFASYNILILINNAIVKNWLVTIMAISEFFILFHWFIYLSLDYKHQ